ncbi:MAG: tRNA-dihydrouridine synthase, partial [Spirochaetota bacterium]
ALAAIQISHAGSGTTEKVCGGKPVAPSAVPHPRKNTHPRALTGEEAGKLRDNFAGAAARAAGAGFDAVELHGAHGFFLNQFLSPLTNLRKDKYGGSLEERAAFPLEVVQAVMRELKDDMLLMYRLGADDLMEGGLKVDSTAQFAKWLQQEGVDIIDVSGGMNSYHIVETNPGFFRTHSRVIKQVVKVPVMVTGGISTAVQAEDVLAACDADIVGIGRALLKNYRWAREALKSLEG